MSGLLGGLRVASRMASAPSWGPTSRAAPGTRQPAIPDAGRFRRGDGDTLWFTGATRTHEPDWCGACLLARKISEWAKAQEERRNASDEAESGHADDPAG